MSGRTAIPPSELYPGGWVAVPRVLLMHPGKRGKHLAVYVALASTAYPEQPRLVARNVRLRRLCERAGVSRSTLVSVLTDLEDWGFIETERIAGFATTYVLLPVETDVTAALEADRSEDRENQQEVASKRDPLRDSGAGVEGETPETPSMDLTNPQPKSDAGPRPELRPLHKTPQDVFQDCGCDPPHRRLDDAGKAKNLRKALGKDTATEAMEEVAFRLRHPEAAGPVSEPWALARTIGECYASRCRDLSHSELHGHEAMSYHRGRRIDFESESRGRQADVDRGSTYEDEISSSHDFDEARERQKEALRLVEQGARGMRFG